MKKTVLWFRPVGRATLPGSLVAPEPPERALVSNFLEKPTPPLLTSLCLSKPTTPDTVVASAGTAGDRKAPKLRGPSAKTALGARFAGREASPGRGS